MTTPDGTSGAVSYLYVTPPAPTVTHVSPNEGALAGGNVVTLTGTGFEMSGAPVVTKVTGRHDCDHRRMRSVPHRAVLRV